MNIIWIPLTMAFVPLIVFVAWALYMFFKELIIVIQLKEWGFLFVMVMVFIFSVGLCWLFSVNLK